MYRKLTYIIKENPEREKSLKDKLFDHFSANPLFVLWNVVLLLGGTVLSAHFFYIGFWPDLDLQSSLALLAIIAVTGLFFLGLIYLNFIFPAYVWSMFLLNTKSGELFRKRMIRSDGEMNWQLPLRLYGVTTVLILVLTLVLSFLIRNEFNGGLLFLTIFVCTCVVVTGVMYRWTIKSIDELKPSSEIIAANKTLSVDTAEQDSGGTNKGTENKGGVANAPHASFADGVLTPPLTKGNIVPSGLP